MYDLTDEIDITVLGGLPITVRYTVRGYYFPATRTSPPEYPEIEFSIYDRKGYYAGWVENRLTPDDEEHIFAAIQQAEIMNEHDRAEHLINLERDSYG